jgi:hypothetical protein
MRDRDRAAARSPARHPQGCRSIYIQKLSKAEQQIEEWQTAVEVLTPSGRKQRRPDDARAHRRHESLEPSCRAGV